MGATPAARVQKNLVDLLAVTKECVVLPLPSYSLKVVEKFVGFKRAQDVLGGDEAMAHFVWASETAHPHLRNELISKIRAYNRDDLWAMWAVMKYLCHLPLAM